MADYWKSLGRHYCDACKCWFGDNKASIEFHEGGKRHQHNVEKQLRDARLKSAKNDKEKLETEATLQQIEQAALSAYLKDVDGKTTEASVEKIAAAQSQRSLPTPPATVDPELQKAAAQLQKIREKQEISQRAAHFLKQKKAEAVVAPPPPPPVPASLWPWQQSYTPEGYIYYYNTQTGVTQWEPPSAEKPSTTTPPPPSSSSSSSSSVVTVGTKRPAGSDGETTTQPPPPAKRHSGPYGSWTVTETYTREEESDSSQQQPQEGDMVRGSSSADKEQDGTSSDEDGEGEEGQEGGGDGKKKKRRTGLKFAEKTLGSDALAGEEERSETAAFKGFTFKKRSGPRTHNIKQRTSDW